MGIERKWSQNRYFNDYDEKSGRRTVTTHQLRVAQDIPFWEPLVRFFRPSALQDYFLVAQTTEASIPFLDDNKNIRIVEDTQGALVGYVYVVPWQEDTEIRWERDRLVFNLKNCISRYSKSPNMLCENFSAEVKKGLEQYQILIHVFHFALFRTGELRIWACKGDALGLENALAHNEQTQAEATVLRSLPKQIYYFIKDAAHNHYHHEPSSDQILPIVQIESGRHLSDQEHSANEIKWRREVLWGLARVLAKYRREGDIKQLRRAQGILAYADSFQSTVAKITRAKYLEDKPEFDDNLTTYDFDHAKQSVSASEGLRNWQNSGNLQMIVGLIAIAFSSFTFWSSAVRLTESRCSATTSNELMKICANFFSERAFFAALWVSKHPLIFLAAVIIPIAMVYSIFVKDLRDAKWAKGPSHFVWALSQVVGASVSAKLSNAYAGFIASLFIPLIVLLCALYALFALVAAMRFG